MHADALVIRQASARHGLITRDEARRAGLSDRQIRQRVRSGAWREVRRGVFALAGAPDSPRLHLCAATLWLPAVGSHRSASWLHGALEDPPHRPEVSTGRDVSHRSGDIRLHRTADLSPRDIQTIDGIRCTNAIRTCIDMGARMTVDDLERFIERARHQRLVHLTPLVTRFLQLARPGRDGIATVREVLRRMDPRLEPLESELEALLVQILRDHGVEAPVRQHPVTIAGKDFRIDVAYPEHRIAIESDGFADHGHRHAFEDDRVRQNLLALDGWTILRFTWRQICGQPEWVADQVRQALARTRPRS